MTSKLVDLSIIIVSFNTAQITQACVRSIIKSFTNTSITYEIIIIDNASNDKTIILLNQINSSHIKIIENKTNSGFAKANNQGVSFASGKYILLLNSDTLILDKAIEKMLIQYKKDPEIHFLGPKLLNNDLTEQASAAPFYSLPVIFGALFLKGDYWGLTRSSPTKFIKTDWVSGACILTTKENYQKLNGFDENIFMYMDEVDLLYRGSKLQLSTYFYPNAKVIHLGSGSSKERTEPILQVYKGFIYFYNKHHSLTEQYLLKNMLKLKAYISLWIGKVINNSYLVKTYEKALEMVG